MRLAAALTLAALLPATGAAQTSFFTSRLVWDPASSAGIVADFNARPIGGTGSFSEGGITFSSPGSQLYIVPIGSTDSNPLPTSPYLVGNGPDIILMSFGSGIRGIGFDVTSNRYAPASIDVYGAGNLLLGSYTMTQAPNSYGFVGISATSDITSVLFTAVNGQIQDAGVDNIRLMGEPTSTVPEPASLALVATGLGLVGLLRRRPRHG